MPVQSPFKLIKLFYDMMKTEVTDGNPLLAKDEQRDLRNSRPLIHDSGRYSPEYVAYLYCNRRVSAVDSILQQSNSVVLDAGCGYGSDTLLFASLGAEVIAVNSSEAELAIVQKRQAYYAKVLSKSLSIAYIHSDLNTYKPTAANISLTWLSSVLAIIENQDAFIQKIFYATLPGGAIAITDYNLLHPPFLMAEWLRRRKAMKSCPAFAREADYLNMVRRRGRKGARFFPIRNGAEFDDVQFLTNRQLKKLLMENGFSSVTTEYGGFILPFCEPESAIWLEKAFSGIKGISWMGRTFVTRGIKG